MNDQISIDEFHGSDGMDDWRVLSEGACAFFATPSMAASAHFVDGIGRLDGVDDHHVDIDIRRGGITVRLITYSEDYMGMSRRDVELARAISAIARDQGLTPDPSAVQSFLVVPGAPNAKEIMPFWQALLGYERRLDSPDEDLVDPRRIGPPFWFEQMDAPRADGLGAIHVAVWLPIEHAEARVAAALAAGGRIVRDEFAPTWWTLADSAGNEADISTTHGRG